MKENRIKRFNENSELNISDVMNSVLTDLHKELSRINNIINSGEAEDNDKYEYYLGRQIGIESSIDIIKKHCS